MPIGLAPTLVEILGKTQSISETNLRRAQEVQQSTGKKLIHVLVDEGIISERDLMFILSSVLGIPVLNLSAYKIDTRVIKLIPKKLAMQHELIPISKIGSTATVAFSDPLNVLALDDVKKISNLHIRPVIASAKEIQAAIESYYTEEVKLEEVLADLDPDTVEVVKEEKTSDGSKAASYIADEAPVIRMVNLILQEAITSRASDIHFEPFARELRIRYRVDGVLRNAFSPPRDMYNALLTRVKIISDLDITEKRLPQDGRFKAQFDKREFDFRVSVLPTHYGEKAVLRVLDKSRVKSGLDYLGFAPESIERFQKAIKRPYGIALVTGPTGSGKSTTLYSILSQLNTRERNIMTIEDPIEYQIQGITQTQVNPDIELTFAAGLRSILRQSPDVILVGEIRDSETADIAVKAALTGHLVFSTLHTNDAAGAVTRLVDMGVEPFLIASSMIVGTAQRLMRKICPQCKEPSEVPADLRERFKREQAWVKDAKAYRGKGCKDCRNTGFHGRIAAMEVLVINEEIQRLIIENKSSGEIGAAARKKGMSTLFENALIAFQNGDTTLEEVLRVTTFDE